MSHIETSAKLPPSHETLIAWAKKIETSDELVAFTKILVDFNFPREAWDTYYVEIKSIPDFIEKEDLISNAINHTSVVLKSNFDLKLVYKGRNWVSFDGGEIASIINSKFFSQLQKNLIVDSLKLKRDRPTDRPLDPIEQMAVWETEDNYAPQLQRSSLPFSVPIKQIARINTDVVALDGIPDFIRDLFLKDDVVHAPIHPMNRSDRVPFFDSPSLPSWVGYLTASRTMIFRNGNQAYSVKMPTDYATTFDLENPSYLKRNMQEDVLQSVARSQLVAEIDKKIGKDPRLKVLLDVLSISDKTGNGLVVRDLSPLLDGHYYLPGTATINGFNRINPEYTQQALRQSAINQGRAQALFLIRYGLQIEEPHRQNFLDQMDSEMKLTHTSVIRYLPDSWLVPSIAGAIHPTALARELEIIAREKESKRNDKIVLQLIDNPQPNPVSIEKFGNIIAKEQKAELTKLLKSVYYQTIRLELGIPGRTPPNSPKFIEAVKRYHESRARLQQGLTN